MDKLQAMHLFTRVVDTGSFTAAAEQLSISRALASKLMQNLEDSLGVRLLNRTTRRLSLTEPGQSYYQRVSDVLALGVLRALEQRRLIPGRDISVTGFDDIPLAEPSGLTTMQQPIRERGRLMGRMLLDPSYPETRVVLPTKLVVRASTGPVPTR